jgi:hypothetical protein
VGVASVMGKTLLNYSPDEPIERGPRLLLLAYQ